MNSDTRDWNLGILAELTKELTRDGEVVLSPAQGRHLLTWVRTLLDVINSQEQLIRALNNMNAGPPAPPTSAGSSAELADKK